MKIGPMDTDQKVFVIAEVGVNHEGDEAVAARLVRLAAQAGADAVKFQTFKVENYVSDAYGEARVQRLKKFALPFEAFGRLARVAGEAGILFLSTPLDLESAKYLDTIAPAFKIASGDNNFWPLLLQVAATGKPTLLSCGLADLAAVDRAKSFIEAEWRRLGITQELALLHCVSSYPVPPDQANLRSIQLLRERFGGTVGYSDHTNGLDAALMSVALGARIIEKHFTLDKHYSEFRDHQLSADPAELKHLISKVRELESRGVGRSGSPARQQAV